MRTRERQRGQALAFVTVTTVIVLLGVVMLFNVAQLTTQKIKLQNTADAAAYSGALAEARDYNFTAYANRAMIANQVAVAQITGLTSWARNLDNAFSSGSWTWSPETWANMSSLSSMYTISANIIKSISGGLKSVMETAGKVLAVALDILIDALYYGTTAYHAAMILTVPETIVEVISQNDPDASLSLSPTQGVFAAKHAYDVYNFTSDYDPTAISGTNADNNKSNSSKDRQANVIWNSHDNFYKFRSFPWMGIPFASPWLIDPTKWIPGNSGTFWMFMYHSGGTELKHDSSGQKMKSWTALDATGLFVWINIWIFVPFPVPIPIILPLPQGWGGAITGNTGNDLNPSSGTHNHNFAEAYGSAFVNPLTIAPAWIKVGEGPGASLDSNGGLKKYWDVTDRDQASSTQHHNLFGPELMVEVEKPMDKITISSSPNLKIGGSDSGRLHLADGTVGNKLKAISKAQAYFARPAKLFPRDDGKIEYGSLYSPYWQARLMPNNLIEQGASLIGQTFAW